jgi:uncharacterized membrane protein
MAQLLLNAQVVATLMMVGIVWFAQMVHYPLFDRVGTASFKTYEADNMRLTNYVVGPLILVEGVTALALFWLRPEGISFGQALLGIGLLVVIWLSTFSLQVPMHRVLARGFDASAHRKLVASNWIRTITWSFRGILMLWMVARV